MTLLASERSLLIRNKFRSVLQLRIQNRKQNEIDSGLKSTCPTHKGEKDQSKALRLTDDGSIQKSPPCGLNAETAKDRSVCVAVRPKKARVADNTCVNIQRRPGPLEQPHTHILPPENHIFEDDVSSCPSSLSPEQLGVVQSPALSLSPGLSSDQSLSDLSPGPSPPTQSPSHTQPGLAMLPAIKGINQAMSMTVGDSNSMGMAGRPKGVYLTSQATPLLPKTARPPTPPDTSLFLLNSLTPSRPPRPRKPRDSKPKMRKLKYHQYIPPDQRSTTGSAGGVASQRSPAPAQPIDPAYSHLLQQQQVFLQLQILQNQQDQDQQQQQQDQQQNHPQLTVAPSGDTNQVVRFSGDTIQNSQPVLMATNHTPKDISPSHKSELLPPNLVDLTVSELRQQLRKRGLPVSGTKPALLQRLRPFQLPRSCLAPTPLCQPGTSLEPLPPSPLLTPNHNPNSSPCSGPDPPTNPNHQVYIQSTGILSGVQNEILNGILNGGPNGTLKGMAVSVVGEQPAFLAPALARSTSPSPGLSPCSFSPLSTGTPWRSEQELQEMSLELEMRERIRSRPKDRVSPPLSKSCGVSLHPFLQQDPGCPRGKSETNGQTEILFTQVFCCQPCDVIGQDFELPMQITASPEQAPPSVRSLEEELQDAINKVQMDPSQSIDDILDESIICMDTRSLSVTELQSPGLPGPSPPPQTDQSQTSCCHSNNDNFLSSPLCSSLLLELPPSPSIMVPRQLAPPPPPPPSICTSPPPPTVTARKRRAPAKFDPADWLEALTSGLHPLSPPSAPFVENDFGLDSDLNVFRELDLMVEQW
ncbi:myocardin isoform X2 [Esox lucius]|uniref:myocardin isoform X2 n=1 Tax=Esox lucius TaxID=8010 RepID=UPI0010BD4FC3|nr:myocardin isoform X2 [Esox lucius]